MIDEAEEVLNEILHTTLFYDNNKRTIAEILFGMDGAEKHYIISERNRLMKKGIAVKNGQLLISPIAGTILKNEIFNYRSNSKYKDNDKWIRVLKSKYGDTKPVRAGDSQTKQKYYIVVSCRRLRCVTQCR